jgi:(2S)-methylsuccinyl-CoA dehydrogenase
MSDRASFLERARAALGEAEARLGRARDALRGRDPDREQVAAYRLALLAADVAAARALVRRAEEEEAPLAARLAALCASEAAGREPPPEEYEAAGEALLDGARVGSGLGADHEMMRETFRKFAEERVVPLAEAVHRQDLLVPDDLIRDLAALGCFGLSVPQRYGGFQDDVQPDNIGMVVVTEELSRGSLGVAGSLITRPEILAKALLKGGTEEQRSRLLPPIAAGEKMVAVCVTEPDFGSDVAGMKVAATRDPGPSGGFRLNGVKTWATFAGRAELLMVLARTDPDLAKKHKGLSILVAEKPPFSGHEFEHVQPGGGRVAGRAIGTIGYRGMHSYEVSFEDYRVAEENLVGGEAGLGKGFYLQMEGFAGGRLQTAARAAGLMRAALEAGLRYAGERRVFGEPIGRFQLSRVKLARMAMLTEAARLLSYEVARLFDEHEGVMEASLVKLFASRAAEYVAREAQQLHGGMGYAEEYAVSRYFVDARVLSIFEGAEEVLALKVIARALLGA